MAVMVTGGAGYIGSHAVKRLLAEGHEVVILDNLSRGHQAAVDKLQSLAPDRCHFSKTDIGDRDAVLETMRAHKVDSVMHFAAFALVGESVDEPIMYHRNNMSEVVELVDACLAANVQRFVFSSTCATYGEPENVPIRETEPQHPINPYGVSKLHVEHLLDDVTTAAQRANKPFSFAALRYFNVAGADRDGVIGEDHDPETHLIPVVLQCCLGQREHVTIFGTDYPTPDGTCIRDYIHVEDLVDAHVKVMRCLVPGDRRKYNLGTGDGLSVRQIIDSVQRVTGMKLKVLEGQRREGDPAMLYADPARIRNELGWSASITNVDEIVASAWAWFKEHPRGYAGA